MRKLRLFGWLVLVSILVVAAACTGEQRQAPAGGASSNHVFVYEPDTSAYIQVTFGTAVGEKEVMQAIEEFGITDMEVRSQDANTVGIKTELLDDSRREELRVALANRLGPIDHFQVTEISTPTSDQMAGVVDIIDRRVALFGIKAFVQLSSGNRVFVEIPKPEDIGRIEDVKSLIGQTARLVFKERTCTDPSCPSYTDADIGLTGDDLATVVPEPSEFDIGWGVNIQFNDRGTNIFSDLTRRIVNKHEKRIAVFLDDELLFAPVVRAWIRDGRVMISGNFTREEARRLTFQLESGRLPVPLRLIEEHVPVAK